jgi:hypothetical protein
MAKTRECFLCKKDCRKRDIVCASCWNGLGQARKDAIALAPYSREEKGRKFLTDLLTCDLKTLKSMVADHKVKPEALKPEEEDMQAIFTEINPGKAPVEQA